LLSHGDIVFYTYPGETVPHHVVIYLGGDKILQAPETGQNVGYGTLSEFPARPPPSAASPNRESQSVNGGALWRRRYSVGEIPW